MSQAPFDARIAYVTSEYPAVSHTFILREVEALRRLGLEVETCSVRQTPVEHHRGPSEKAAAQSTFYILRALRRPVGLARALWALVRQPGRMVQTVGLAWRTRRPGAAGLAYQCIYLLEAAALAAHVTSRRITHIHDHFGANSCTVAMLASALTGVPFSFTLHGPSIFFEPRLARLDEKIARARFVACISHFCRAQGMIFADPEHWPRMRIVHCGIDPTRYGGALPDPARKRLLLVGRLAAVKGVFVLLDALEHVLRRHPDTVLTLVGDGPERARIEAHVRDKGLTEAVRMTGYLSQSEVADEMRRSDLFVLPSFAEGVPVVLMEAMASGLPVIASQVAGIGELVETGVSGRLINPGDVAGLAVAISEYLDPGVDRAGMGAVGRARVEAAFHIDKEAAWLAQLFTQLDAMPGLRPPSDPDARNGSF
jgi:glycosyltransferase involved in cell wall biosynthesis